VLVNVQALDLLLFTDAQAVDRLDAEKRQPRGDRQVS
jgi:hypothetical protein